MLGGAASKPKAGEPPKPQQHRPPPASSIPVALHAQHQHVPPALLSLGVAGGLATSWTAAQHEEWLRAMAMAQPSYQSAAGVRHRGMPPSMPPSALPSAAGRHLPSFSHTHDDERVQTSQAAQAETTGTATAGKRQGGQMGTGALSNSIGAWTSSGIFVSKSRAGRVDESVDVGAQANPSGVYPVMQPMAYLPRPQPPPPSVPLRGHMIHGKSDTLKRQHAGSLAAATNPRPRRAQPPTHGPGMQRLGHEAAHSRPVSAPAGSVFYSPGGGAFKRPPPPSPGVGLRRASTSATRGRVGSAVVGAGPSKAAMRAAARAAAAASVISAVADSRETGARAAAAAARASAGAAGSTELESG